MATLLLVIIYITFIGLGIPDSLLGTAWPSIYREFGLPISYQSFLAVTISGGTILSSFFSAKLINRFGTNVVTAVSTCLTAIALIGFAVSPNLVWMGFFAIPLGIGAGSIDVALNNFVALHYSATQMSFLHCFYGVGVSVSPYILALVINSPYGWRGGYKIAFAIQCGIALLLFLTLGLWKKVTKINAAEEVESRTISFREGIKIPGVFQICLVFFTSCAIECTTGGWGSTFLVEKKGFPAEKAAQIIMIYYIGMMVGRFLSGIIAAKYSSWRIIMIGQVVIGIALAALLFSFENYGIAAGFFLIGLGNGPLFPNLNYLTPENFGQDISQSVIGIQMSFAYIGILIAPLLCGLLGQMMGMGMFPIYLILCYFIMLIATGTAKKKIKEEKKR